MINEQRLEQLRTGITTTKLLSPKEKAEWLSLLDLMNEKQVSDLEEILSVKHAVPELVPSPAEVEQTPPKLTHISNLPAGMPGLSKATPPIKPKLAAPLDAQKTVHSRTNSDMANLTDPPMLATEQQDTSNRQRQPLTIKAGLAPVGTPPVRKKPQFELKSLEEVAGLDISSFRTFDSTTFLKSISSLVAVFGYFAVLQGFESSKLYQSYLTRGKSLLAGQSVEDKYMVTQEEFELIADVLQSIRVNR